MRRMPFLCYRMSKWRAESDSAGGMWGTIVDGYLPCWSETLCGRDVAKQRLISKCVSFWRVRDIWGNTFTGWERWSHFVLILPGRGWCLSWLLHLWSFRWRERALASSVEGHKYWFTQYFRLSKKRYWSTCRRSKDAWKNLRYLVWGLWSVKKQDLWPSMISHSQGGSGMDHHSP